MGEGMSLGVLPGVRSDGGGLRVGEVSKMSSSPPVGVLTAGCERFVSLSGLPGTQLRLLAKTTRRLER